MPLITPPDAGPVTAAPDRVVDRRVVADGAVVARPPAQGEVVSVGPAVVGPDPVERWHAATRDRPLEPVRPLPADLRPLVRTVTGTAATVGYTSGAATRAALAASGARAATSRGVLHLPDPPRADSPASVALVAHELAHLRSPVVRPRFLLHDHASGADEDERGAQAVARTAVGALPVAGGTRVVAEVARRAALTAVAAMAPGVPMVPDLSAGTVPDLGAVGSPGASPSGDVPGTTPSPSSSPSPGAAPGGGTTPGAGGTGTSGGGARAGDRLDLDRVVEALEDRLVAELERRGGRWAGVF